MSTFPAPPNPDSLNARTAGALAEEAGRVYQYLAAIARASATVAELCADEADRFAGMDDESADTFGVHETAENAYRSARMAETAADLAEHHDALQAADDIEPEAVAAVAEHLAAQVAAALTAITAGK